MNRKDIDPILRNNIICDCILFDYQFAQAVIVIFRKDTTQSGEIGKQVYFI